MKTFSPTSRGLVREDILSSTDRRDWLRSSANENLEYGHLPVGGDEIKETHIPAIPKTRYKRKRFRAVTCLSSLAADIDMVTDWAFLIHTRNMDKMRRAEFAEDPIEGENPFLVPPILLWLLLITCVLGTTLWLVLATDGAVAAPLFRRLSIDKISMGYVLFLSVLVEDIPQVVLTFLVEDYYEDGHEMNNFALVNVVASLYDTLIKLAEAFDERGDVVETGVWCKESIWAHHRVVTAVIALPVPNANEIDISSNSNRVSRMHVNTKRRAQRRSMLEDVREIVAEAQLPRLRFLSTSLDKTIRLWDTSAKVTGHKRDRYIRCYRGHQHSISCISFLGDQPSSCTGPSTINPQDSPLEKEANQHFLSGDENGVTKLWDLQGNCMRNYFNAADKGIRVTGIASVNKREAFVCGYASGSARLWGLQSGICIGEYTGHNASVTSVCSLEDSCRFLTGSEDGTIRLWDTSKAMESIPDKATSSLLLSDYTPIKESVSTQTFIGHNGPVLAVACVEPGVSFLSGSADGTARLWFLLEGGGCLRIYAGHEDAVTTVAIVDQVTFLTGSKDKTIKIWDASSGDCLRTYTGHTGPVTAVSMAQDGTFVSASEDKTIKLWVFTAVLPDQPQDMTLGQMLEMNDNVCSH